MSKTQTDLFQNTDENEYALQSYKEFESINAFCKYLNIEPKKEDIKVNMTLCFSLNQALLGALAGATYVSPFVGRLDDIGHDGMELVRDIVDVFEYYQLTTEVIAASIRHPEHCVAAAKAGAHIATVPYKVLTQMTHHPLTDIGITRFLTDWQRVSQQ